ncbi:MAG: hypothetical protein ACYDIC_09240 [Desulfobaccales bacterium]
MKKKESFWTSFAGILTGVASLVTALTGLLYFYFLIQAKEKTEPVSPPAVTVLPTTPPDLAEQPPSRPAPVPAPAVAPAPVPSAIIVRVTAKSQVKAGDDTTIMVTALSRDGKAVLSKARVDLTATAGYFEDTRSPQISGFTNNQGVFKADWETLKEAIPKGAQTVDFQATITLGNQKASGKTAITVVRD